MSRCAACGLICDECSIFIAASDRQQAEALALKWQAAGIAQAQADWFQCQGCSGPVELVWSSDCAIRQCCLVDHQLANCSQCADFPCTLVLDFENDGHEQHGAAIGRLRARR